VVSYVLVSMGYTTWTPQMCQYDCRGHEEVYSMMTHIHGQ